MPDDDKPVSMETISFPFDRMTVERFRNAFPRARWNDSLQAWTVPGKTARRRLDRWLARESAESDVFADERGRDAFDFEPIDSPYVEASDRGLRVRTPYSRTVVSELRQVPFARWDGDQRAWIVPFASVEDLRQRWPTIEEAARRTEPQERRKRAEARKGTEEDKQARRRAAERRRRRLPVPGDDLPPLDRPIATRAYGIVVLVDITGELVEPEAVAEFYPTVREGDIWANWRPPGFDELVRTWPAKGSAVPDGERAWWQPTRDELREARRAARSLERRKVS